MANRKYTPEEIKAYYENVIADPGLSSEGRAQKLQGAMGTYDVSNEDLAAALGLPYSKIESNLLTNKQIDDYIDNILNNPAYSQATKNSMIRDAANTYGVSPDRIKEATKGEYTLSMDNVGQSGVDFKGSTGLREAYGPYVTDYLSRMSALLAMRDVDPTTGKAAFTGLKFGDADTARGGYGVETANNLKSIQSQRENMMNTLRDTITNPKPVYTPYKYSFTPKKGASGGIMSLVEEYDAGGEVGASTTGEQAVSSTYTGTSGFTPTTFTSGYIAPTAYKAPTDISAGFTKPDTYTPGTISSGYTTPADIYKAGTIASTYTAPEEYTAANISSGFTKPTPYTAANISSGFTKPTPYTAANINTDVFDAAQRDKYMSPYTSGVVDPQLREAKRQAELAKQAQAAKFTQAGAFGGSRGAIAESELGRNLATQLSDIYGKGQQEAFLNAQQQFERDQQRKLEAAKANELSKQFGADIGLRGETTAAQLGLEAAKANELSKQFGADIGLRGETTAAQLGLEAAKANELSKQFGYGQKARAAEIAATLGLDAAKANELAKQVAGQQALSSAQTAAQLGLDAQRAQEQAKQFGADFGLRGATTQAQLKLQELQALEQAKQVAGQQGLTGAEAAARLGLDASKLTEQSKQFGATYEQQAAQISAQYNQQARELQQRAEEAQARGDQAAAQLAQQQLIANQQLAQQQLQEAQRAAEAARAFEYQQQRDAYLDKFREIAFANQVLAGLPTSAAPTGVSPVSDAAKAAISTAGVLFPGG